MKVVQINAVCGKGTSTGRTVYEWSDFLNEQNIDNLIFYGNGTSDRENAIFIGSKLDHKLHALFSRVIGKQGYFSYFATKKLIKQMKQFKPDLIHLRNLHGNYICMPLLFDYIIKNQIATVITLHDCFLYTGKCVHYIGANCYRWQQECGNCPQLKSGNTSWFFDCTKSMLKDRKKWFSQIKRLGVTGVSEWVTNEGKKSVLAPNAEFRAIYNWIDLDNFKPHQSDIRKKLGIENKFMILGIASSWSAAKGLGDFNKLADMLDDRFKIVLVGQKNGEMNKKIMHLEPTSNIQLLSDLYAAADVFFNPSKMETFGKVTAEALACGTPVIAYDATACPELVGEGCGYVEKVGDVEAVCRDIISMKSENKDFTDICRAFAKENFSKEELLKKTLAFYCELLEEERG